MDCKRLILIFVTLAAVALADDNSGARSAKYDSDLLALGVHGTTVLSYPFVEYQRLIIDHLAVGAFAFYTESSSGDTTRRLKGYAATLDFYALDGFRGLWVRAGYGRYTFETRSGADRESFQQSGILA